MTYTAEQLREWANNKAVGSLLADQLRAHADALEENARLRAELAKLRQHAEAMLADLEALRCGLGQTASHFKSAKDFRADFPKGTK